MALKNFLTWNAIGPVNAEEGRGVLTDSAQSWRTSNLNGFHVAFPMLHFVAELVVEGRESGYTSAMQKSLKTPLSKQPPADFLEWFQNEFLKRRQKNENYSVRAFSSYLDISPATVSHLLAGKRTPSVKFATKLFSKLEMSPAEKEQVLASLSRRKPTPESRSRSSEENYRMIALDSFKLMSEWYHYAILEMTDVVGFKLDYRWIANQLNISVTEARQAVERLLRLDLVETKSGTLVKRQGFVTNGDDTLTSSAHKQLQRHVLQKALDAIDTTSIEEKDISSITMAIDESKLPAAKKLITKFRRDLCAFLEDGKQTRVFNLAVQLYPVSKKQKK